MISASARGADRDQLGFVDKLIKGEPHKKSRLHALDGTFIGTRALVTDLPRTLVGVTRRRLLGQYPVAPWAPYSLARALDRIAAGYRRRGREFHVLEIGAGMSTIWWAQRATHVHAIEHDAEWHDQLLRELHLRNITNVTIDFVPDDDEYPDLSRFADASFDLLTADGHSRHKVIAQAPRLIRRPGAILLGDTDKAAVWHEHYGEALELLLRFAKDEGAEHRYFTGLTPSSLSAVQDLLVRFPAR